VAFGTEQTLLQWRLVLNRSYEMFVTRRWEEGEEEEEEKEEDEEEKPKKKKKWKQKKRI